MVQPTLRIPEAELQVLKLLWHQGASTIKELADRLYPGGGSSGYATVQKLLQRLIEKSCVHRRRSAGGNLYTAAIDRATLIARRLQETADQLCGGSITPLLTQLVSSPEVSQADLETIRRLVEELESQTAPEEEQ